MDIQRIARHLFAPYWRLDRTFPRQTLLAIEESIKASESMHAGEIRFVVEGTLDGAALLKGQTASERAIDVFSLLRIWDTENNNGLLIYLLLADRAVEIVADRGIHAKVGAQVWEKICREMEDAFRAANYADGVVNGVRAVTRQLSKHFPMQEPHRNELPNKPVLL
jgi:uncharacterized membrane protein YgcG